MPDLGEDSLPVEEDSQDSDQPATQAPEATPEFAGPEINAVLRLRVVRGFPPFKQQTNTEKEMELRRKTTESPAQVKLRQIENLIIYRHREEILVGEAMCSSTGGFDKGVTQRRLDFWAIKPSWQRPQYTGYEVKVSRQDFTRDNKAHLYEPQCHHFIWVTAPGVVRDISEIPENHGWQEMNGTGTRLITRKKAPRLRIDNSAVFNAMKSAFMRTTRPGVGLTQREYFRQWLENREVNQELGRRTSQAIREEIDRKIIKVQRENDKLRRENGELAEIKAAMEKYKPRAWSADAKAKLLIEAAEAEAMGIPRGTIENMRRRGKALEKIAVELEQMRKPIRDQG